MNNLEIARGIATIVSVYFIVTSLMIAVVITKLNRVISLMKKKNNDKEKN